ncbi:hypothetical protein GKZ90_0022265 [Flavobacterium sp. MC2016-06]|uniref:hypothetical protein n=1 Tax=Flavobacterium sp. MC2016-06 TaxID=2676308 RepID=UPI0012BADAF9|nr:hypothetical protein [Flavobacterium sp. MC2016-06]MBU3861273.1 hypothetical protein [Flavobacterium sp. MC2016-06]
MKYTIIIIVLLFSSCKNRDEEIGRPDPYTLTERDISEDCSAFQMRFKDGKYILNFALSGTCQNLKVEYYIKEYSRYLNFYHDSLKNRRGYIMLKYHRNSFLNTNIRDLQDSIINITKSNFKTNVSLIESDDNYFMIKVGNGNLSD